MNSWSDINKLTEVLLMWICTRAIRERYSRFVAYNSLVDVPQSPPHHSETEWSY